MDFAVKGCLGQPVGSDGRQLLHVGAKLPPQGQGGQQPSHQVAPLGSSSHSYTILIGSCVSDLQIMSELQAQCYMFPKSINNSAKLMSF